MWSYTGLLSILVRKVISQIVIGSSIRARSRSLVEGMLGEGTWALAAEQIGPIFFADALVVAAEAIQSSAGSAGSVSELRWVSAIAVAPEAVHNEA